MPRNTTHYDPNQKVYLTKQQSLKTKANFVALTNSYNEPIKEFLSHLSIIT